MKAKLYILMIQCDRPITQKKNRSMGFSFVISFINIKNCQEATLTTGSTGSLGHWINWVTGSTFSFDPVTQSKKVTQMTQLTQSNSATNTSRKCFTRQIINSLYWVFKKSQVG